VTAETVSPDGLKVQVAHRLNPYQYLLTDEQLDDVLLTLGLRRAASIWANHTDPEAPYGQYPETAMGFVLLDATAAPWTPNEEAVLGAVIIGDLGHEFLPNAAAKAGAHRRLGQNNGEGVLVDPHRLSTGDFRYGHSAEVRGQIAAASSQDADQDLYEAGRLAAEFVDAIGERHRAWAKLTGPGDWLSADDTPAPEYQAMVAWYPGRAGNS